MKLWQSDLDLNELPEFLTRAIPRIDAVNARGPRGRRVSSRTTPVALPMTQ